MSLLKDIIGRGATGSKPAAGTEGRLYFDTSLGKLQRDSGSAWQDVAETTAGSVASDTIWDAAGDLAVGTGADTAAKLSLGASGKFLKSNGSTVAYAYPPGYELDYVEQTSSLTVTATTDATAQAFVTGNAVSYDGSTRVFVEVYAEYGSATVALLANLYDGSTDLGRIWQLNSPTTAGTNAGLFARRFLTPSNASHTFSVRFWKTSGTSIVNAGAGGTATVLPGYIRVCIA